MRLTDRRRSRRRLQVTGPHCVLSLWHTDDAPSDSIWFFFCMPLRFVSVWVLECERTDSQQLPFHRRRLFTTLYQTEWDIEVRYYFELTRLYHIPNSTAQVSDTDDSSVSKRFLPFQNQDEITRANNRDNRLSKYFIQYPNLINTPRPNHSTGSMSYFNERWWWKEVIIVCNLAPLLCTHSGKTFRTHWVEKDLCICFRHLHVYGNLWPQHITGDELLTVAVHAWADGCENVSGFLLINTDIS